MFHLFKKVYVDFDDKINMSYDRVICSEQFGGTGDSTDLSRVFYGERIASEKTIDDLIGKNKPFETFLELLETLNTRVDDFKSRVFIYCDKKSYYKLSIMWMKIILPHGTEESAWKFFKAHIFKEKNFANSRVSATTRFTESAESWMLLEAEFKEYWSSIKLSRQKKTTYKDFLEQVATSMRIEFLLCGYLYDGRYADILAKAITPLVKKDLEKLLYEQKEIILVHFLRPEFQRLLQVKSGPYDFNNFYDMVDDESPLVRIMFDPKIWGNTKSCLYTASSNGKINLSAFTDDDIQNLKDYSEAAGKVWSDEQWYNVTSSEVDKFDFIKMFRDKDQLSVEDLDTILDYEIYNTTHAAGSFHSAALRTVNTYFVDYVLQNKDNKDKLKPYVFEITY